MRFNSEKQCLFCADGQDGCGGSKENLGREIQ